MSDFPFIRVDPDIMDPMRSLSEGYDEPNLGNRIPGFPAEAMTDPNPIKWDEASENLNETPGDLIFKAVLCNDKNSLTQILKKRKTEPQPLWADDEKCNALHLAASKPEYRECLELLFQYDGCSILVDKDGQTSLGQTALHIACEFGCEETVFVLLTNGCDPEKRTCTGRAALHIAASNGYVTIIRYLLDKSADIESETVEGYTPLHVAVETGHLDVTELLLANGANVLAVNHEGHLPLHLACRSATFETVRLLMEHNSASINNSNSYGITPFMIAVDNFDTNEIKYLLENGAKADIGDEESKMVLHFATSQKPESFALLIQSMDVSRTQGCCLWDFLNVMAVYDSPRYFVVSFDSLTGLAIRMGADYLNVLLNSHLPKGILEMPSLRCRLAECRSIFSPLAYLFFYFVSEKMEKFDECLDILLKHKITMVEEFKRIFGRPWPRSHIRFINPLSVLISSLWPDNSRERYFNLLIENNVTTDYCLQCYNYNDESFVTFNDYKVYYNPVIYAIEQGDVAVVKLYISNSVILEPDVLCNYLIMAFAKNNHLSAKDVEEARSLYGYLISLKPIYYKWNEQSNHDDLNKCPFMPAVEKFSDEELADYQSSEYYHQESPFFANLEGYDSLCIRHLRGLPDFEQFPFITPSEEFVNVKLQQLCRTVIRQQLREPTLEGNLRNFRRKILELPLPTFLKEYLLFKT